MWNAELSEWQRALEAYPTVIQAYEKSVDSKQGLVDLERLMWEELGEAVLARDIPSLEADEYRRVIKWKLKRGKWRPRLQKFADDLDDTLIKEQSQKALLALKNGQIQEAISHLSKLRGCGPATASAILAACDNSVPFMADELLVAVPCFNGQRDYTISVYITLVDEVRKKVQELCRQGGDWDARNVERAVFSMSISQKLNIRVENPVATIMPKKGEVDEVKKQDRGADTAQGNSKPVAPKAKPGSKRKNVRENGSSTASDPPRRKSARLQRKS